MPEKRFDGNSEEFKNFLNRKKYELLRRKALVTRQIAKDTIQHTVEQIEDVLCLDYFVKAPVMSMEELVATIKNDRNRDIAYRDKLQAEFNNMKDEHSSAIKRANAIRQADPDATEENNEELKDIWELHNEYQFLEHEIPIVSKDIELRHLLLGMIHRPKGYFSKADKAV